MPKKLLAVTLIIVVACVLAFPLLQPLLEKGCDLNHPQSLVLIVIDASNRLERGDKEYAIAQISDLVANQPKDSVAMLVEPAARAAYEPVVGPGRCGRAVPWYISTFLSSAKAMDARAAAEQQLLGAVRAEAEAALNAPEAPLSPLVETLIYLSKRYDFEHAAVRDVYMYSDMEENSEISTVYSEHPKALQFRTAGFEPTDLRGATIHVRYVVRHSHPSTMELRVKAFWKGWIEKSNGTLDWPG